MKADAHMHLPGAFDACLTPGWLGSTFVVPAHSAWSGMPPEEERPVDLECDWDMRRTLMVNAVSRETPDAAGGGQPLS